MLLLFLQQNHAKKSYKSQFIKLKTLTSMYIYEADVETPEPVCSSARPQTSQLSLRCSCEEYNQKTEIQRIHTIPSKFIPQVQCTLSSCHLLKGAYKIQGTMCFTISRIYAEYSEESLLEGLYIIVNIKHFCRSTEHNFP